MKTHLEYTDEKSSKFWNIEVDGNTCSILYGKIGTDCQTITKNFVSVEAATKYAEKLISSKLKKGYLVTLQEGNEKEISKKWFDRLNRKIFTIYKTAILKYPQKKFKYIQLNWTGQGFALGISTDVNDENHQHVNDGDWHNQELSSLESVYRELENIPYEEYDEDDDEYYEMEFEREEWPNNSSDCYELEYFLINVGLGIAYLKLIKDKETKKRLEHIEVVKIVSVDRKIAPFTYYSPSTKTKQEIIQTLLSNDKEQQLILELWSNKTEKSGVEFLNNF